MFSSHLFWTSGLSDVPAGVTQEGGHTGFLNHLPSAVRALCFLARRIQPLLSVVDREDVEFCVLTIKLFSTCWAFLFVCFFSPEKSQLPGFDLTSQRVRRFRSYQLNYRGERSCRTYNRQDCRLYSCTYLIFLSSGVVCKKHTAPVYSERYHRHYCLLVRSTSFFPD